MNLKHNGVWGWSIYCLNGRGIYGLNRWVIYGLNGWGIFDLNGWGKIGKGKLQRKGRRNFQQKQAAEREKHTRSGKQQVVLFVMAYSLLKILQMNVTPAWEHLREILLLEKELIGSLREWIHCSCLCTYENGLYICHNCKVTFF